MSGIEAGAGTLVISLAKVKFKCEIASEPREASGHRCALGGLGARVHNSGKHWVGFFRAPPLPWSGFPIPELVVFQAVAVARGDCGLWANSRLLMSPGPSWRPSWGG